MDIIAVPLLMMAAIGLLFIDHGDGGSGDDGDADADTTRKLTSDPDDQLLILQSFGDDGDSVIGTDGRDQLELGGGDDIADGGAANDRLFGEDGNDQVAGGPGDDRIFLGAGSDANFWIDAPNAEQVAGDDFIRGGDGEDTLVDFLGRNTIYGELGADLIDGVDGNGEAESPDELYGGYGRDVVAGDNGDLLSGGADMDAFFVVLNAGPIEPAVISDYEVGEGIFITVPLAFQGQDPVLESNGGGVDVRLGGEVILRIEGVNDPDDVDFFFGAQDIADQTVTPGALRLGTQGDDQISTGSGDDAVFAARGDDEISTGAGDDYISLRTTYPFAAEGSLGWGNNSVQAGSGDDRVLGGFGDDTISGGMGRDLIEGGGGADTLYGGDGADVIDGYDLDNPKSDVLFGGNGDDRLILDDGDIATGGHGQDVFDIEEFARGDAIVRITDFEPGRDQIEIGVEGNDLTVRFARDGDDTRVFVGSSEVALIEGLRPSEIPARAVQVSSYA